MVKMVEVEVPLSRPPLGPLTGVAAARRTSVAILVASRKYRDSI